MNTLPRCERWLAAGGYGRRSEVPVFSRSFRDAAVITKVRFGVEAAAIEWNEGGFGEGGFADWAMPRGSIEMEPAKNTRPAIKVAAEGDDWIGGEVEADIAIKAGGRGGGGDVLGRGNELRRGFNDEILEVAVQSPFRVHITVEKGKVLS
ncbi:hypothetical protein IEQ34_009575 [Dendrobium chrysotoxum]|uniref:Uncharacterized protein n=1 Tax=Dendrobium chrysotoxum TaxID=161865 RepID=A0AAV7GJH1_DENCH|nr:hypothetical protein IEQ34_009575 [Dendrobium chrysotoxum]